MINIRVILLSFICGSLIKPYSVYVTFFSVLCFYVFPVWFLRMSIMLLIDLSLCKVSLPGLHKQWFPWVPGSLPLTQCTRWPVGTGIYPRSTRGLRVSDLLPFLCLYVVVVNTFSDQLMDLADGDLILASLVRDPSPSCTALQSSDRQISMPFVLYSHW